MPLTLDEFKALTIVLPTECDMIHRKDKGGNLTGSFIDFKQVLICLGKCVKETPPEPAIVLPAGVERN